MLIQNILFKFAFKIFKMAKIFKIWQMFIIGFLSGIISGGVIVWLEMKDENRNFLSQILFELNTLKLEKKIFEEEQLKEKNTGKKTTRPQGNYHSTSGKNENKKMDSGIDSALVPMASDTATVLASLPDTLWNNSLLPREEEIIVRKDRMVHSASLLLNNKDQAFAQKSENDSVLENLNEIHNEEPGKYHVEFWESPINYKGYKMGNKKIILFGIGDEFEKITLFQIDNHIYLKYYDAVYPLENTYNFEPLKKVTEKSLLAKFE